MLVLAAPGLVVFVLAPVPRALDLPVAPGESDPVDDEPVVLVPGEVP